MGIFLGVMFILFGLLFVGMGIFYIIDAVKNK